MSRNTEFIPFHRPSLGAEEESAVLEVLRSGWLSTAGKAADFESRFAGFLGVKNALAVNSATSGLHLALEALRIPPGSFVAVPAFTFTATGEVCRYVGAHPLLVDIREDTLNIDPDRLEEAVRERAASGNRVSGIIPVHVAGLCCDMETLGDLSGRYRIPIVEDAAHAFPVKAPAGWVGCLGTVGVFSFYATKPITTGEGGMIVTEDDDLAERMRIMRLHGIDRTVWDRYRSRGAAWEYDVVAPGYKYNMSDISAAIGIEQLKKAKAFREERERIARMYLRGFKGIDFLRPPTDAENHAWHLFILRIRPERLTITRNEFIGRLNEKGIGVSVHFKPLHLMSYYKIEYSLSPRDFPAACKAFETCISLPLYPGLSDEQIDYIVRTVIDIGKNRYRV